MLSSWYRDIERRVTNMVSRGIVTKLDDSGKSQSCSLSVMTGENLSKVERVQQYGFTSFPPPDAQATVVYVTGSREFPIIIAADHPENRLKLKQGESAMYTMWDTHLHLKDDKSLDGKAEKLNLDFGKEATIKSPKTKIESDKFAVKSSGDELLKVLSDLAAAIAGMEGKLITADPGKPVVAAAFVATITPIKARLDKFIG